MSKQDNEIPVSKWNNNPGNLRPSGWTYEGQIGVDGRGFAIFEDYESGRRALEKDIDIKLSRGINSPNKFIDYYLGDPKKDVENSAESRANYKKYVAKHLGMEDPDAEFAGDSVSKIADAVEAFEGGTWNKATKQETAKPAPEPKIGIDQKPIEEVIDVPPPSGEVPANRTADQPGSEKAVRGLLGAEGAILGASANAGMPGIGDIIGSRGNVGRAIFGMATNPDTRSTRWGLDAYTRKMFPMDTNVHLKDLENEMTRLNRAADPSAPKVKLRTMSEVQDAIAKTKEISPEPVRKELYKYDPNRPKAPVNLSQTEGRYIQSMTKGQPGVDLSRYIQNPNTPIRNMAMAPVKGALNIVNKISPSLFKVTGGALGGLGALQSGYETAENVKNKGWSDAETLGSLAQTVGGGLMVVPTLPTQLIGAGLTGVGMLPKMYRNIRKQDPITDDQITAALQAFGT